MMPGEIQSDIEPGLCSGCGVKIVDKFYLLAVDRPWHVHCLRCSDCQLSLDSNVTCFAKDGYIFCKEDYYRRFSTKRCARCGSGISSNEFVMRARDSIYHIACFACVSCNRLLSPGDHFGMKNGHVFCQSHFDSLPVGSCALDGDYLPNIPPIQQEALPLSGAAQPLTPGGYGGRPKGQKGRPRKRKAQVARVDEEGCVPAFGMATENELAGLDSADGYGPHPSRQKRMRTSFKHHQLRIMRSYFALNHNPDAKDLKQLAQKTGLSKRVLQVWFQNARAKYRRSVLKQDPNKSEADAPDSGDGECGSSHNINSGNNSVFTELPPSDNMSPPISDVSCGSSSSSSSSSSYSTLLQSGMDAEPGPATGNNLSQLFGSTLSAIN